VSKATALRDERRASLLGWYDAQGRDLPWRIRGGAGDPYRVWLSEVMLQQTTVAAVGPYFAKFLQLFPSVADLAAAPRDQVLAAWAGLGYYSRARNLHAAAQILAAQGFPQDESSWRALPGVGPYTAAALTAIALQQPANAVDGNIERVMARLHAVETPLPGAKPALKALAETYVTPQRPGDWVQALMDLGATICTPKAPKCLLCPLQDSCVAFKTGAPESYPRKGTKAERPRRYGVVFRLENDKGALWLVRRPDKGLLGGMAALPTTPWTEAPINDVAAHAPIEAQWEDVGAIEHVFTHFALTLQVWRAKLPSRKKPNGDGWWDDARALPTVFKKAALLQAGE
jgi:A/G-specific adenine glycosylase